MSTTIAKLWANRIIVGLKTYNDVPAKLKEQVKEILVDVDRSDLVTE